VDELEVVLVDVVELLVNDVLLALGLMEVVVDVDDVLLELELLLLDVVLLELVCQQWSTWRNWK
jgi:hypothetical protein